MRKPKMYRDDGHTYVCLSCCMYICIRYTMAASSLPVIHEWSVMIAKVSLSKLTMNVNRVDHKQSAIV